MARCGVSSCSALVRKCPRVSGGQVETPRPFRFHVALNGATQHRRRKMRVPRWSLMVIAALLVSACATATGPREVMQYSIEQFLGNTSVLGASFSSDSERILVSSDAEGVYNAYVIDIASGEKRRLTDSEDAVFVVSYFPHDERFLFSADQGGNELNHLYVREANGSVHDLTPGENLKADFLGWSADKRHLFVMSNERDPRFFDVYRYASDGYARELLWQNGSGLQPALVSPDGRYIALVKSNTTSDSDILLHDTRTNET